MAYFVPLPFLGSVLVFYVLYVWCRKSPYTEVSFWSFGFKAWQFPYAMLVASMLLGANPLGDIIGIFVGHVYYFLTTAIPDRYNKNPLATPQFLYQLFNHAEVHSHTQGWQRSGGYRLGGT